MGGQCGTYRGAHNAYRFVVGKRDREKQLGRPTCRWEDNIKMHLEEVGWEGVDWIRMTQDMDKRRDLVNMVVGFLVP
jgi:hypothetical protein